MSKYIIDTNEWANLFDVQTVGIFGIGEDCITGDKTVYSRTFHIDDFPKLTDGYVNEHFYHLLEEAFQIGLDHAWEAARKIACTPQEEGLGRKMLDAVFGDALDRSEIMFTYSAQEAIDKIKAYEDEQKKKDPIKVGDIVERYIDGKLDSKGVFLQEDGGYWRCLFDTGAVLMTFAHPKGQFKKTGKHYDIQSILDAMKQ